jgi:hypothetical protein
MKNKILIFCLLLVSLIACSSDDNKNNKELQEELDVTVENIQGKWLAVEYSDHSGSVFQPYQPIEKGDQYTYTFKSDLSFLNTSTSNCDGFYEVNQEDSKLILTFESGCSAATSISTVSEITKNLMILIRSAGDEAVKIKYRKQ